MVIDLTGDSEDEAPAPPQPPPTEPPTEPPPTEPPTEPPPPDDATDAAGDDPAPTYAVGAIVAAANRTDVPMTVISVQDRVYKIRYGVEADAWRGKTESFAESALVRFGTSLGPRRRRAPRHFDEAAAPQPPPSPRVFDRGTVVEARWKGGADWSDWFPGKIAARRDDATYDVAYDDGDVEYGIAAALIRRPPTTRESVALGQEFQVHFRGSGEHRGVITGLKDKAIEVTWRPVLMKPGEVDAPEVEECDLAEIEAYKERDRYHARRRCDVAEVRRRTPKRTAEEEAPRDAKRGTRAKRKRRQSRDAHADVRRSPKSSFLEIFSGKQVLSDALLGGAWDVETLDDGSWAGARPATYACDVRDFEVAAVGYRDAVHASIPCKTWSWLAAGKHRPGKGAARKIQGATDEARRANGVVARTIDLLREAKRVNPDVVMTIENPVGVLKDYKPWTDAALELGLKRVQVSWELRVSRIVRAPTRRCVGTASSAPTSGSTRTSGRTRSSSSPARRTWSARRPRRAPSTATTSASGTGTPPRAPSSRPASPPGSLWASIPPPPRRAGARGANVPKSLVRRRSSGRAAGSRATARTRRSRRRDGTRSRQSRRPAARCSHACGSVVEPQDYTNSIGSLRVSACLLWRRTATLGAVFTWRNGKCATSTRRPA